MKILEFAFIIYPATNLKRSRAFFEGVLGLSSSTSMTDGDQFYIEYEIGPHTLGVGNEPFLNPSGDGPHLVLEVDDFEQAIDHLKRHNVTFAVEPLRNDGVSDRRPGRQSFVDRTDFKHDQLNPIPAPAFLTCHSCRG